MQSLIDIGTTFCRRQWISDFRNGSLLWSARSYPRIPTKFIALRVLPSFVSSTKTLWSLVFSFLLLGVLLIVSYKLLYFSFRWGSRRVDRYQVVRNDAFYTKEHIGFLVARHLLFLTLRSGRSQYKCPPTVYNLNSPSAAWYFTGAWWSTSKSNLNVRRPHRSSFADESETFSVHFRYCSWFCL